MIHNLKQANKQKQDKAVQARHLSDIEQKKHEI